LRRKCPRSRHGFLTVSEKPDSSFLAIRHHSKPFLCPLQASPPSQPALAVPAGAVTLRSVTRVWVAPCSPPVLVDVAAPPDRQRHTTARCPSATDAWARSVPPLATSPGSQAMPRPHPRAGRVSVGPLAVLASGALPSRPTVTDACAGVGRTGRPGQGPQPPDRWGLLRGLRWLGEGHELSKGQQGHPCGDEATERGHPAVDCGHQPVQQQTQAQPAPADPPEEKPTHGDAAQPR